MYFVCEFEIVQYIPVIVVCWDLQRVMIGSVRFAGWSTTVLSVWYVVAEC
jgi:hypothetical protein